MNDEPGEYSHIGEFGDFVPADAYDTAVPEPEALARIIVAKEKVLTNDPDRPATLEDLDDYEQALRVYVAAQIIEQLYNETGRRPTPIAGDSAE